jgi:hypothetical protein
MQRSEKFVEEVDTAKVRETSMIKGDSNVSWRPTHFKPHLTRGDVRLIVLQRRSDPHQNRLWTAFQMSECAGFRF